MKKEKSWIEEMIKISTIIIIIWGIFFIGYIFVSKEIGFYLTSIPSIPKGDILALSQLAQIGDAFNILTSLFAGLAFAAVIVTIKVQQNELVETREEFKKQRKIMDIQQFDNKFFQMLNVFNEVIKNIKSFKDQHKNGGAMTFQKLRENALLEFTNTEPQHFISSFEKFNDTYNLSIKYYFLNLYQILNYIDTEYNIDYLKTDETNKEEELKKEKKKYTNIVRAQLSKDELVLLFYNCIGVSNINGTRYKELIEEYEFFEHLKYEDLLNPLAKEKYNVDKSFPQMEKLCNEEVEKYDSIRGVGAQISDNFKLTNYLLLEYGKEAFGDNNQLKEIIKKISSEKQN